MSQPIILVPLDGTAQARAALPVARSLAEAFGASLRILHVSDAPPPPLLEVAEALGLAETALPAWSLEARAGEPAQTIVQVARETRARLIVMCTRTAGGRPESLLGRSALKVLQGAPCAVVLLPPDLELAAWRPQRILLPYDGSPAGNAAVALAGELAHAADAEIIVLQVGAAGVGAPADRGSLSMPRYVDQPQHEWSHWADELLERLACLCPGGKLHAHVRVRGGDPGAEIVRLATDEAADLVVLAWKGVWIDERAMTLKAVLREARCPVMVARAEVQAAAD